MQTRHVRDVMLPLDRYATVHRDATIRDALDALAAAQDKLGGEAHHHRAVLVLDDDRRVVGKLSLLAILAGCQPWVLKHDDPSSVMRMSRVEDYVRALRDRPASLEGDIGLLVAEASRVRARDAMVPVDVSIDEDATLFDAIYALVVRWTQSMLVTRGDEVVGILRMSDVFEVLSDAVRAAPRA